MGIDPGIADTGFGLISKEKGGKIKCLSYGSIKTSAKIGMAERLETLSEELEKTIKEHQPDLVAIERLFFCKNVKTAMAVSQARGVILLICQKNKRKIIEFTPLEVKQAVCSYGQAGKSQVQKMVKILLGLSKEIKPDDAADALAIAVSAVNYL